MLRLYELRQQEGLTQKALAAAFGMSAGNLCDWEKGRTEPDMEKLVMIADYFDVSLDYLLGREDRGQSSAESLKCRLLTAYGRLSQEGKERLVDFLEKI